MQGRVHQRQHLELRLRCGAKYFSRIFLDGGYTVRTAEFRLLQRVQMFRMGDTPSLLQCFQMLRVENTPNAPPNV